MLPTLLEESREAVEEVARRDEPLAPGETVDPNRADAVALDRLPGLGPSAAAAIVAAREDGAVFRRPDDLLSVRGIGPGTLARIRDFLALGAPPVSPPRAPGRGGPLPAAPPDPGPIDVNRADLELLQKLPGVGPALAERILVARREQPFTSLEDLARVKGIGPATVERIRPYATVGR